MMSPPPVSPTKIHAAGLPDPALPPPALSSQERAFTASDLIARQQKLEEEARQAISFSMGKCTFEMGYIRQPVYACRTCGGGGVCAHCSIGCHADHDLIELFAKRHFRCDCGTPNLYRSRADGVPAHYPPCSLRKPGYDPENEENVYMQNFDGKFCYCEKGTQYDPANEEETMYQCLACEEWYHESCTSLGPKAAVNAEKRPVDNTSEDPNVAPSSSQIKPEEPQMLLDSDQVDTFVCSNCVIDSSKSDVLLHYIGTEGFAAILPADVLALEGGNAVERGGVPVTFVEVRDGNGDAAGMKKYAVLGASQDASPESSGAVVLPATSTSKDTLASPQEGEQISAGNKRKAEGGLDIDADIPSSSSIDAERDAKRAKIAESSLVQPSSSALPSESSSMMPSSSLTQANNGNPDEGAQRPLSSSQTTLPPSSSLIATSAKTQDTSDPVPSSDADVEDPDTTLKLSQTPKHGKTESSAAQTGCRLPPKLALRAGLSSVQELASGPRANGDTRFDIFLSPDFREKICKCADCLPRWKSLPFVLVEEDTYSPPSSERESTVDDAGSVSNASTYDLGLAALQKLPRDRLIDTMGAYNKFKDELYAHLRPHADSGEVVTEASIRNFFASRIGAGASKSTH